MESDPTLDGTLGIWDTANLENGRKKWEEEKLLTKWRHRKESQEHVARPMNAPETGNSANKGTLVSGKQQRVFRLNKNYILTVQNLVEANLLMTPVLWEAFLVSFALPLRRNE